MTPPPEPSAPTPPAARRPTIVAHRANSLGPSPPGRNRPGQTSADETSADETSADETSADETSADETSADETSAGENSLAAIVAAAVAGADAVELDVRRTADGHLVLAHDPFQWQPWHGVPLPLPVRWSRRRWVPSLVDLDQALDGAFTADVDVKLDVKDASVAAEVRQHCRDLRVDPARVALWCRSPAEVADPANHDVFGEIALLADGQDTWGYLRDAASSHATAISLNPDLLSAESVSAAHQQGLTVYAWITEKGRHRNAVGLGVDGLVTDWIEYARAARH